MFTFWDPKSTLKAKLKKGEEEHYSDGDGFGSHFEDIEAISGSFRQLWGHLEPFGAIGPTMS